MRGDIKSLEENIVKFKLSKAELQQKLEAINDSTYDLKHELNKKHEKIEELGKELERYTEYRNKVQNSMKRNGINVNNSSSLSANTTFSIGYTVRGLNSSMISERDASRFTNRSNNNSMIIE